MSPSPRIGIPPVVALAVLLGLLGTGAAALVLAGTSASPVSGVRRAGVGDRQRGLAVPARSALPGAVSAGAVSGGAMPAKPAPARSADTRTGIRLLTEAAAACLDVTYRGVQVVSWQGRGNTTVSVVDVWHRPGQATVARAFDAASVPHVVGQRGLTEQDPNAVLGVSRHLLALLQANYQVEYAGRGMAGDRLAQIVAIRRPGGSIAARFWLDLATKLPLRRELFDSRAHVISSDAFIDLQLGERGRGAMPTPAAQPWAGRLGPAGLAALRAAGWPLPATLPGGLSLFAASETSSRLPHVVELSFSDGLSVVSLFVQRGVLPRVVPGWQRIVVHGHVVYAADPDGRSLSWSAGGFVLTVIADAPAATVSAVVAALPHPAQGGFWVRLGRGLRRLVSWANPFH